MQIFEIAIEDYQSNSLKSKLIYYNNCLRKKYNAKLDFNLKIYFRKWDELFPLEKKLIDMSYGNILDIGSSTGYYIPYLMNKGNTIGIEISSKINRIARKNGIYNTILGDFFTYKFKDNFDTITLIGNDIALSGTIPRLKKMLKRFDKMLNETGQVLIIIRHIRTLKYWHVVITPQYNGQYGIPAKYLFLNTFYFMKLAMKCGFNSTIIEKDDSTGLLYYLVRLVKNL
ncbi:MAG: methyltransferase domain-containing protein [Promethearchaeota archaeon]|jgi:SAM-dependent methyltransferase